ncbi:hypothetical protein B484DRAFT_395457, partial [Ochromonadaceae sp. CCMP2298]
MKRTLHEDSGEDSDSNPAPTARAYKNSVGNSAKFPQQVKKTAEQGENVRLKNRDELDTFMLRRFRECIVADVQDPSDAEKVILTMSYNIPGPNGAMKAHKEDANRLRHRRWTDRTIHDYTYVETEELLRDNVKYTDNDMFCTVWLEKYFVKYGDVSPDSQFVKLMVLAKRDLFKQYAAEMKGLGQDAVEESRFLKIWSVLFPRYCINGCGKRIIYTAGSFTNTLKQSITDVKEHGRGVSLYRTLDTVCKGADFTIYCVLDRLEQFRIRNGRWPEV